MLQALSKEKQLAYLDTSNLSDLMYPKIKEIYDCILIDIKDEIEEERINFSRVIKMYGDKTGYESSCNEFRINDFVECGSDLEVIKMTLPVMESWKEKLECDFPQYNFYLILSFSDGYATLRMHRKRNDEKNWLTNDLESYKHEAILVKEI